MSKKSVDFSLLGLGLLIAVGCISVPAHAALAQFAAGSYNLGSDLSGGATPSPTTPCGTGGTDALVFTGSGVNNIGIHSYSCGLGFFEFGSRSSGENTYYVDGSASVIGDLPSGASGFGFFISPGQVGAKIAAAFRTVLAAGISQLNTGALTNAWARFSHLPQMTAYAKDPSKYPFPKTLPPDASEATSDIHLSALMAVGFVLFLITFIVNAIARWLVWRVSGEVRV